MSWASAANIVIHYVMSIDWRTRLKKIIDETPGLSMKAVSLKAGLHASAVHDMVQRGQAPSIDKFLAICDALGIAPSVLLDGETTAPSVPVVGFVSDGEAWTPVSSSTVQTNDVQFSLGSHDTIGIEVRDDSMSPVYRNRDFLICYRQFGPNADNCIGLDCVVRTLDNRHYVKILKRGSRPGRFNLKSYNPHVDDIEDVALSWAAPIAWVRRAA